MESEELEVVEGDVVLVRELEGEVTIIDTFSDDTSAWCYKALNSKGNEWYIKKKDVYMILHNINDNFVKEAESNWTDKHYDNFYTLSEKDIAAGKIKVDTYFVSNVWRVGSKDDSGALWHSLKTINRFGEKNEKSREIKALYNQAKALARIHGVELE